MKIFISGGCKNGKSTFAQQLAKAQQKSDLYYIATMQSTGHEDDERIQNHIEERAGWGFQTVEQAEGISSVLSTCKANGSFLVDSLTALLANEMFLTPEQPNLQVAEKIKAELRLLLDRLQDIVIVSDYIYSDIERYDELTEAYRKSLAQLDRFVAKNCDIVIEVVYTNMVIHKGKEIYEATFKRVLHVDGHVSKHSVSEDEMGRRQSQICTFVLSVRRSVYWCMVVGTR